MIGRLFISVRYFSNHLRRSGLDMFIARSLVDSAITKLKEQTRNVYKGHSKALEFVNKRNEKISQTNMDENQTLEIDALETTSSVKRHRKKKRITDELIDDEGNSCALEVSYLKISTNFLKLKNIIYKFICSILYLHLVSNVYCQ